MLLLSLLLSAASGATFPEESQRDIWDRGCADWPARLSEAPLEPNPALKVEKSSGLVRVLVSVRIRPEPGETIPELLQSVLMKLGDGFVYPAWVLPGINEKPDGGNYFVAVNGLSVTEREPREFGLTGPYTFEVLWFRRTGAATLDFRPDDLPLPECPAFPAGHFLARRLLYRMTPREDLLKLLMAELWIYPQSDSVRLQMRMAAQPSPLVYQLLPELLVRRELEARGRRLFENFLELRRNARAIRLATAAVAPTKAKTESHPKKALRVKR